VELTYTLTGVDRETGERVSSPITAAEFEQIIVAAEGLPDPNDVADDEGGDD
jgi:hypothetical protein